MAFFTLHKNYILRTTHGHSIGFVKGEATYVPPLCVPDALSVGAVPVDGIESVDPEEVEVAPLSPSERKAAVFKAFDTMSKRGERMDFNASGLPNNKRIPALTGFEITTNERDAFWTEYKAIAEASKSQTELDLRVGS
jgi:hypothetical protein